MKRQQDHLTAPATKILSVLHVKDPKVPAIERANNAESTEGTTKCGQLMYVIEQWQLLEQLPGESICPRCINPDAAADFEQGELL